MYCEFCGTKIEADDVYCPQCGAIVADNEETVIEPVQPEGLPEIKLQRQEPYRPAQTSSQQEVPFRPAQTSSQQEIPFRPAQTSSQQEPYRPTQTQPKPAMHIPTPSMTEIADKAGESLKKVVDAASNFVPSPVGNAMDIVLAQNEEVVRRYNCADLKGVMGYMLVTNKRLMFTASGGRSRINQEVTLSSVSGLTCHRGTNLIWNRIIIGVLLVLIGLYSFFSMGDSYYGGSGIGMLGVMLLIFGAILIFLGFRPAYMVAIYAKDVSLSPIVVGEGPKTLMGNSALYAFYCKPTAETEVMISELGALIQDLQSMGDLAITKWKSPAEVLPRV